MTNEVSGNTSASAPPPDFRLLFRNCNSISEAEITLRRSSLNIKYGPNGTGKSTIARALLLNAEGGAALKSLLPFKSRVDGGAADQPSVEGADEISSVLVFDETYVSQFVFQQDEVLKNSFEIFINTPDYQAGIAEIEQNFEHLKELFVENHVLDDVIRNFTELRDAFTLTKSGAIAKTSKGFKALGMGGKLATIPKPLQGFSEFLHGIDPAGWISWQAKGKAYLELSDRCPFCSRPNIDKRTAIRVSEEYESTAVKNLSALRITIGKLGGFFAPAYLEKLVKITTSLDELSPEQSQFLVGLKGQIETLLGKFTALKALSFQALRDVADIESSLRGLKIDLSLLNAVDSEATSEVVVAINEQLDEVATQISEIKARIGKQKARVAKSIRANQDEINEFLISAGYKYSVRIEPSAASYRMILEHNDASGHVEAAAQHLSFGERNAFALVLFMHHVRRENPTLVVLDDPVSSFDKTKKFAILHKLFHGKTSLRDCTTLLLTHDIEPAIDIVRTATSGQFRAASPFVSFLQSQGGRATEKEILPDDLMTFTRVCDVNIASTADVAIKCIYLRRRFEIHGELGGEYDVLSSLLHLREKPTSKLGDGTSEPLGLDAVETAVASIQTHIPDFDYEGLLAQLRNLDLLIGKFNSTRVGYEKVQIARIALALYPNSPAGDAAFKKFVNESYHIENEYVMQLNPRDFDAVPEHVIESCEKLLVQLAYA